ncbi:MAG: polyamine aminopropyltransferase [Burkholderiaceae bacterium]
MNTNNANNADLTSEREEDYSDLPATQAHVLLGSIMIVALCGIVYELIIGTVSSYLLGNSVYQFSLTIGFFMFAMGVGSYLSRFIGNRLIHAFVCVELILGLVGGLCSVTLFMMFPFAPWLYKTAMFSFILLIGTLVGLEIPLLTRVLSDRKGTRRSIADVMSLDYVGALIGSVAFPMLLLPSLGLITASFAIGLINILVAIANIFWLRDYLHKPKRLLAAALLMLAGLILLTISASRITSFAQQHLYFDQIVWKQQTPYQTLVVTNDWPKRDLRLFIDGHLQFSEVDEHRYHESLVHPAMSWNDGSKPVSTVLVLGGGDGLAVREILKYPSVQQIDLVDLDPAMTTLGTEFAPMVRMNERSLQSPKVNLINQDAFIFVKQSSKIYDRIIVDFPDPHNEAIAKLYSVEFYAMLAARMAPDGVMVTQSSSPFFVRNAYWTVGHTINEIFPEVTSYSVSVPAFGVWGFHLASRQTGGRVQSLPANLKFMSEAVFNAARVFPPDIGRPADPLHVNSIFNPELYEVYLKDLSEGPVPKRSGWAIGD